MSDALREAEMLAFEAWMRSDGTLPLDRDSFDYADFHVALMWHTWEARAALTAPAQEAAGDDWQHLKPHGYAPGNYMNKCHRCEQVATGLDKRAVTCRPCAEVLHAARSASPAPAVPAEPDMRHPKIQRLIGAKARCEIELRLVEQLLDEGPECDLTSMDMEYWHGLHDKLRDKLLAAAPQAAPQPTQEN